MKRLIAIILTISIVLCLGVTTYGVENSKKNEEKGSLFVSAEGMIFKASVPIRIIIKSEDLDGRVIRMDYSIRNMCLMGPFKVLNLNIGLNSNWFFSKSYDSFRYDRNSSGVQKMLLRLDGNAVYDKNAEGFNLKEDGVLIVYASTSVPIKVDVIMENLTEDFRYTVAILVFTLDTKLNN